MKYTLGLITAVLSFSANIVLAENEPTYIEVVQAPAIVKLVNSDGNIIEYSTELLKHGFAESDTQVSLFSYHGSPIKPRCHGDLGKLAEDFTLIIKTEEGLKKSVTLQATPSSQREFSIFGTCSGDSNMLEKLLINVKVD
jgi:hypothetical protein